MISRRRYGLVSLASLAGLLLDLWGGSWLISQLSDWDWRLVPTVITIYMIGITCFGLFVGFGITYTVPPRAGPVR